MKILNNKTITLIVSYTNSDIKINSLINNIKYFNKISNTIVIINSNKYKKLKLEEQIKKNMVI